MAPILSLRSALVARSAHLSRGDIAGIVIGIFFGLLFLVLGIIPLILRIRYQARCQRLQKVATTGAGAAPVTGDLGTGPPSSLDAPAPWGDTRGSTSHPSKEYDVDVLGGDDSSKDGQRRDRRTSSAVSATVVAATIQTGAAGQGPPKPGAISTNVDSGLAGSVPRPATQPQNWTSDANAAQPDHQTASVGLSGEVLSESPRDMSPSEERFRRADTMESTTSDARKSRLSRMSSTIKDFTHAVFGSYRRRSTRSVGSTEFELPFEDQMPAQPDENMVPTISAPSYYPEPGMPQGENASYYSGVPLSPPSSEHSPQPPQPLQYSEPPAVTMVETTQTNRRLSIPRIPRDRWYHRQRRRAKMAQVPHVLPMSPESPFAPLEYSPEEEENDKRSLSDLEEAEEKIKKGKKIMITPSPRQPAPGTVNPMDIMKPSNAVEKDWMINHELDRIENSPSPMLSAPEVVMTDAGPSRDTLADSMREDYQRQPEPKMADPEIPMYGDKMADVSDSSTTPQVAQVLGASNQDTPETRPTPPDSGESTSSSSSNVIQLASPNPPPDTGATSGSSPNSHKCELCGSEFPQANQLNHHTRYHVRPVKCPECDRWFGTKTHLARHVNDVHKTTRVFYCTEPNCSYSPAGGKSFKRKDNWQRHMKNKHQITAEGDPLAVDVTMAGTS